jgi:3beta-hydroxy-delta5-steroid dehydrogenase/steroid delta-isomerase
MNAAGGDESAPYSTSRDLYTSTKIAAERAVLDANGNGLLTCAIRPGGIYGPGERMTYGRLVRALWSSATALHGSITSTSTIW